MTFSSIQFHCKETRGYHFGTFLKNTIFKTFKALGCELENWKIAKKRQEITTIANKLLDINYLFRRIDFLENAMSVILDSHQLKGIYLSRLKLK